MKFLNIAFIILLAHQVHSFPLSSENSTETIETTEATIITRELLNDNERIITPDYFNNDFISVQEFINAGVLNDDVIKRSTKVKREAPKDADKIVAKRALIFRPLFVYKQQEVKRQRVQEQRATRRPVRTRPPTYGGNRPVG
ncbi:hypothetical protein ACKWTF_013373 [Chironomus riparius]